jgi:MerR family redox-sensitive transcriptional activator SoxR
MTISEFARHAGLRPSAIRYYEQLGILPAPPRTSGQRRYDAAALRRLAVVQRARQAGFTLAEIRQLFYGFRGNVPPSTRWKSLSQRKLAELDELMDGIRTMRRLLQRLKSCRCDALVECGRRILARGLTPTLPGRRSPASFRAG